MKTVTFELSKPISYANGSGQNIEANHISLEEPTGKVSHLCCEIESLIQSGLLNMADMINKDDIEAAKEAAKAKNDEETTGPDADAVLSIMSSGGVNMTKVVLTFRELFKMVALMGGEKPLTTPRMDDMSHKDFRQMMGEYAANFILN